MSNISLKESYSELLEKKENLESELKEIQRVLEDRDTLFNAISKKRWFFFKNREKFIFDRESGYLWANLNSFPLKSLTYEDAKREVEKIEWHGLRDWRLPTFSEFKFMIEDKSFPFQIGRNWRITDKEYFVYSNGRINLDYLSQHSNVLWKGYYIPCNSRYASDKFSKKNSNGYRAERAIVNLFIEEGWIPELDSSRLEEIFFILVREFRLLKEIEMVEETKKNNLSLIFNPKKSLKSFNLEEINGSIIKYTKASIDWIDNLILGVENLKIEHKPLLKDILKSKKILNSSIKIEELTTKEREFLEKESSNLKEKFDFGLDSLIGQLLEFKEESINLRDRLNSIKSGRDKLISLYEMENYKRPSFEIFVEYTSQIVKDKLKEMEWFAEHQKYINRALELRKEWLDDYDIFVDKVKRDFYRYCEDEMVDEDSYKLWFSEWREERFLILSKLFELVKEVENLPPNRILEIFELAKSYRDKLDRFYKFERVAIHQNPKFRGLIEKYEKERELSKIRGEFQKELERIIFELNSTQERIFLSRWAKDWISIQLDEVLTYIEKDKLIDTKPIFKRIFEEFKELKRGNFEEFLNDVEAYEEAREKQEKSYNSLLYKMNRELERLDKGI